MQLFRRYKKSVQANRWERWRRIFDLLEDRQVVPIVDLVRETGSRAAIIEKDVETLCQRGLVKRTAKGGLTLESFHAEKPLEERSAEDIDAKSGMARVAAERYIHHGMKLFLDGSTSVAAILPYISAMRLTVTTNSLSIIGELRKRRFAGDIYCTGGSYRSKSNTVIGNNAIRTIEHHPADLTILGVEGISSKMELMEAHPGEALIKQAMVTNSNRTLILAMPHKLNDDSLLTFATLKDVHALISTEFSDPTFAENARNLGVELIATQSSS
jgi:DeoR/GlpR family transcriptional regulator of sugar metabolism